MERQSGVIRADHVNRYRFAANRLHEMSVLDAACGVGYGSRMIYDAGNRVQAVDASLEAIEVATRVYPGPEYIHSRIENKPWRGRFDATVSFETVEHLPDPESALKSFPGDYLICSTPNELLYPFRAENFKGEEYPHLRHYTPDELTQLLTNSGWIVNERWCQKSKVGEVEIGTEGIFLVYVCGR